MATPLARCQVEITAWGPHEGCAEFMSEPDVFQCGHDAVECLVIDDFEYAAMTGDSPRDEWLLCAAHAQEARDDVAKRAAALTLVSAAAV